MENIKTIKKINAEVKNVENSELSNEALGQYYCGHINSGFLVKC